MDNDEKTGRQNSPIREGGKGEGKRERNNHYSGLHWHSQAKRYCKYD
jgi:hypothetical protein